MFTAEMVFRAAKGKGRTIGIGSLEGSESVRTSMALAEATGYGHPVAYFDAVSLVEDLRDGKVDAAVRGDLDSKEAMAAIKSVFGLKKIMRMALLQPRGEGIFFLAPVGVDEGETVAEKIELARRGAAFISRMGVEVRIGVMSGGRNTDRGRSKIVDKTIDEADEMVLKLKEDGLDAEDVQILIEDAVKNKTIVIAPDGISGNLIFRCIHLVDGGRSMGAPVLNLDKVFIDTSRAKGSYVDSIALASALSANAIHPHKGHPGNIKR
ncbi:MAG: hypothetical protein A4E32_01999 [Methanomassiliicoccales archaeon PtaU1.Bin124]|nr:MAG: hypothetical protein A4E32_01999 [Methanomassiliicoccales archaeon PtaU1.Bin124]